MTKRFLFVLPSLDPGGAERNIVTLASHLSLWARVDLAVVRMRGELLDNIPDNIQVHDLGSTRKVFYRLPLLVKELHPFAVLSTIWDLNIIIALMRPLFPADTRLIFREAIIPSAHFGEKIYRYPFHKLYARLYRRAHTVIVLSKEMRRVLVENYLLDPEKVRVVYNAVSTDRLTALRKGNSLDSGDGTITILSVGRLERQKGFDNLVRAFHVVNREFPFLQLKIAGEGGERRALEKLIQTLGLEDRVQLPGQCTNPFSGVDKKTIYAMTSHYEGFSNALLEALALGLPVLATNSNCSASEIIIDGVNGFLVADSTVEDIANGLRRAIRNYASLDCPGIPEQAGYEFGMDQYLDGYRDVLCGSEKGEL